MFRPSDESPPNDEPCDEPCDEKPPLLKPPLKPPLDGRLYWYGDGGSATTKVAMATANNCSASAREKEEETENSCLIRWMRRGTSIARATEDRGRGPPAIGSEINPVRCPRQTAKAANTTLNAY